MIIRKSDWRWIIRKLRRTKRGGHYVPFRVSFPFIIPSGAYWGNFSPSEKFTGPIPEGGGFIALRGDRFFSYQDLREILEELFHEKIEIEE